MAWLILHRCNDSDPEPRPYGLVKKNNDHGDPITVAQCTTVCRERLVFEGHGPFDEAVTAQEAHGSHLPPGFVIAKAVVD